MANTNDITRIPEHQSTNITASGAVAGAGSLLWGVQLVGGSAETTLTVYDNTSAAGTIVFQAAVPIGTSQFCDITDLGPLKCYIGMYASLAGAGGSAQLFWDA